MSSPTLPLAQEISKEIRNFVSGATFGSKYNRKDLAKSAIFLLKTLPSAREAILEYLCTVFDDAVNVYCHNVDLELGNGTAGSSLHSAAEDPDDNIIQDVQHILSGFITSNPEAWSPIVSAWSLDLLGQLSSKYSESRGIPHASSLNEVLQLWMSCRPMRTLVDLSTQCISTLIGSNTDLCIDALLDTSVQHSPHFDWVVAHIGSCFPTTIINRVLACGLKDFCSPSEEPPDIGTGILPTPSKKVPKMASVVGILGHLAGHHSEDIRKALLALFEDSFVPNPCVQDLATVPFLLQLASMSSMLRRVITTDFVKALSPKILNDLYVQIPKWYQTTSQSADDLISLVVHMILQSEEGGEQIVHFLLNTAAPDMKGTPPCSPQVSQVCGLILDFLLLQIHYLVNSKSSSFPVDVPILTALQKGIVPLCRHLLEDNVLKAPWVSKLLAYQAIYGKENVASDVLAEMLVNASKPSQLAFLSHLMTMMEPTANHNLLETTVTQIVTESMGKGRYCPDQFLVNLWHVVQWEADGQGGFGLTRLRFTDCLPRFLPSLSDQLLHPSLEAACCVMDTLARLPLPDTLPMSVLTSLCISSVSHFVGVVAKMDLAAKLTRIPLCCKFVSKLCKQASAQQVTLRALLETVLDRKNASHFNTSVTDASAGGSAASEGFSLLEENQKHAVSNTLPQSHSTVFHAGIIGDGLRPAPKTVAKPEDEILVNVQLLLEMFKSACVSCRRTPDDKFPVGPTPTIQGMTSVALLLVELISSDVMFNGLPWPDDDFTKVTIERDLHIKRTFDANPVLWDLLYLVAHCRPALCYCSVLLRALAAIIMSFWAACQASATSACPNQLELTCRLIDVMAIGQLLPPPLSHMGEIFPHISPYEAYMLLVDVWKYMKENVPSPIEFASIDAQSYPWRNFGPACEPKYTNRLHCILQSNMAKFGSLFIRFFSGEENA